MKSKGKTVKTRLSDAEIDALVEAQADSASAWNKPTKVRRGKSASVSLPADLAARAVFLAKLNREKNVDSWLARIVRNALN